MPNGFGYNEPLRRGRSPFGPTGPFVPPSGGLPLLGKFKRRLGRVRRGTSSQLPVREPATFPAREPATATEPATAATQLQGLEKPVRKSGRVRRGRRGRRGRTEPLTYQAE